MCTLCGNLNLFLSVRFYTNLNDIIGIWKAANFVEFLQFEIYQSQIVEMAFFFLEIIQNKIHVL